MTDETPSTPDDAAELPPPVPPAPRRRRALARLLLVAGAALLALGVAEGALRVLGVGGVMTFAPDERWGYLMRPGQVVYAYGHPVATDARGLRAPAGREPGPPTALRILFVGDSVTYGGGRIREAELFCRRVERALAEEGVPVRVTNASAPGWGPQNWRGYLAAEGLLGADVVVLVLPECDLARPFATMAMHGFRQRAPRTRVGAVLGKLAALARPRDPYAAHDPDEAHRANCAAARWLKGRAAGEAAVLAVFLPGRPAGGEALAAAPSPRWGCFETVFPGALDLRGDLGDPGLFLDPIHLSPAGHALVAERVLERLRTLPELRGARAAGPPRRLTAFAP
jgi:lysophospholipase L1-like esterase